MCLLYTAENECKKCQASKYIIPWNQPVTNSLYTFGPRFSKLITSTCSTAEVQRTGSYNVARVLSDNRFNSGALSVCGSHFVLLHLAYACDARYESSDTPCDRDGPVTWLSLHIRTRDRHAERAAKGESQEVWKAITRNTSRCFLIATGEAHGGVEECKVEVKNGTA